jgi:hypothetical protein
VSKKAFNNTSNVHVGKRALTRYHQQTGSRRLLTYKRLQDSEVPADALAAYAVQRLELQEAHRTGIGGTANELNDFRKKVRK